MLKLITNPKTTDYSSVYEFLSWFFLNGLYAFLLHNINSTYYRNFCLPFGRNLVQGSREFLVPFCNSMSCLNTSIKTKNDNKKFDWKLRNKLFWYLEISHWEKVYLANGEGVHGSRWKTLVNKAKNWATLQENGDYFKMSNKLHSCSKTIKLWLLHVVCKLGIWLIGWTNILDSSGAYSNMLPWCKIILAEYLGCGLVSHWLCPLSPS